MLGSFCPFDNVSLVHLKILYKNQVYQSDLREDSKSSLTFANFDNLLSSNSSFKDEL